MNHKHDHRVCSVANTIKVLNDHWTFLVVREAFFGVKSFEQFQKNLGIATNILSGRLKMLVENGIFIKSQNPEDGRRFIYKLTEKGMDLYPIVLAIMNWGDRWLTNEDDPPLRLFHRKCGKPFKPVMRCEECGEPIHAKEMMYEEKFPLKP